jgi:outer membrane protein OmpA-like peptidoglycan-associated protein
MINAGNRHLAHFFYLVITLLLTACPGQKSLVVPSTQDRKATQNSLVVLLPEDDKDTGEVTVVNSHGSQLLNKPWQSLEIPAVDKQPTIPAVMGETAVHGVFAEVLTAMPAPAVHYILYFSQNTVMLTPNSKLLLPVIIKAIDKRHPAQLSVIGHTDTMGTTDYNYQLGLLRAKTLASLLKSLGAAPASIETSSHGKTDLLVKTGDQIPEQRNRRVEITIR